MGTPLFGVQWRKTSAERRAAHEVMDFIEERKLLFVDRHVDDVEHCVRSALEIWAFIAEQLEQHDVGRELSVTLKSMRAACRRFVEAAGPQGENFGSQTSVAGARRLGLALGDLRSQMGFYVAAMAAQYLIEVDDDLSVILPPRPHGQDEDENV
ncbi:hypothetical protein FXF51_31315 [Nonomuraea sp. PA05]|uniref:DUF6650 family protein n=1 Tax=Nonomuraea sp. PA05 TaxID=2604466 RepID=UPI0011D30F8B|nr:DUF6650 family protein [Nonomuraea sp. PA05]TYB60695.1 hypothetical protein FXF51_31315 [Nonomuraea sp. PA05]